MKREREEGFTLIELLVVMIIIGILAAIAIPVFLSQKNKARETTAKSDIVAIATDINSVLVDGTAKALTISSAGSTYTIAGTDANDQAISVTGNLSVGNFVKPIPAARQYIAPPAANAGAFCVEIDNTATGTNPWKYDTIASATASVSQGVC